MKKILTSIAAGLMISAQVLAVSVKDVCGRFNGDLNIGGTPYPNKSVYLLPGVVDNTVTFVLPDFMFNAGKLGNIVLPNIPMSANGQLTLENATLYLDSISERATITVVNGLEDGGQVYNSIVTASEAQVILSIAAPSLVEPIYVLFAGQAVKTQNYVLPNSGFEGEWTNNEPEGWHSFGSACGLFVDFIKENTFQFVQSDVVRPGSAGSHSALISSNIVMGVKANGNCTNGQVNAGSMTATDSLGNYNFSDPDSAFVTPFHGRPDSIVFWAKYQPADLNPSNEVNQARLNAVITTNARYQDPESNSSHAACKIGAATLNYSANADMSWQRLAVPFAYEANKADQAPAYILATFSTNKLPGGGSSYTTGGTFAKQNILDSVYIDDGGLVLLDIVIDDVPDERFVDDEVVILLEEIVDYLIQDVFVDERGLVLRDVFVDYLEQDIVVDDLCYVVLHEGVHYLLDERVVEDRGPVLRDILVEDLIEDVLAENQRIVFLDIFYEDVEQILIVEDDFLMLVDIVVDDLFHQLYVDEVRMALDVLVDHLYDELVVEDVDLVDVDVIGDYLVKNLVVDEYLFMLLDERQEDAGYDVDVDVLGGILEIVLVEELFQQLVIENRGVILIQVADDHLLHDGDVEQLAVILLYIGGDHLEQHLVADEGGGMGTDIVVDDLQQDLVVDGDRRINVEALERHSSVDGYDPLPGVLVVLHYGSGAGGGHRKAVRVGEHHAVYGPVETAADIHHADVGGGGKRSGRAFLQHDDAAVAERELVAVSGCFHLSHIHAGLRRRGKDGKLLQLTVDAGDLLFQLVYPFFDLGVLVVQAVDFLLKVLPACRHYNCCEGKDKYAFHSCDDNNLYVRQFLLRAG